MLRFSIRRILMMIPTLFVISIIVFVIIQLPPGDIVTSRIQELQQQGQEISQEQIEALRARFNLDAPIHIQYFKWIGGIFRGDLGYSMMFDQPVSSLIWERLGYTTLIAILCMLFTWVVAFPIGIFSALRQYTLGDYFFTVLAFLGLSIPNFMLALLIMYVGSEYLGMQEVGGLFSLEFMNAPWSLDRIVNLLKNIWIPVVVVGVAGTAGLMRIMRANLLDELQKPYVITARAKGVSPAKLILKYPVRIAINPFVSTIGWMLPAMFSGEVIVASVLALPTTGPLLLHSLLNQDMYLAGSFILILSALTVFGTLLSDIL